jgi:hypothetical protein
MPVTAEDLDAATTTVVDALQATAGRDWTAVPAPAVGVDCWQEGEHIGDTLISYAGQLVAQPPGRYVRFVVSANRDAAAADVLEFMLAGGRILASVVRTSPPDRRAFHPSGMADPEGFAGMGCVEMLVHGYDIADALGVPLEPPGDLCARVLARMFPGVDTGGADPWAVLLWATGRIDLPGRDRVGPGWRWRGAPLADRAL